MLRPKPELYGIILFSYVGNVPGREVRIPINQPVQLRFVVFGDGFSSNRSKLVQEILAKVKKSWHVMYMYL